MKNSENEENAHGTRTIEARGGNDDDVDRDGKIPRPRDET
jgi:hypothetical protein